MSATAGQRDPPFAVEGTGARIFVLGSPVDETLLMRSRPSRRNSDTYGPAMDTLQYEAGSWQSWADLKWTTPEGGQQRQPSAKRASS
jgi:hypothetical protein